jgi:hypothetical protein
MLVERPNCGYSGMPETENQHDCIRTDRGPLRILTSSGDRLDIMPVNGLSFSNCNRKCGASSEDHVSSSSCSAAILPNDNS